METKTLYLISTSFLGVVSVIIYCLRARVKLESKERYTNIFYASFIFHGYLFAGFSIYDLSTNMFHHEYIFISIGVLLASALMSFLLFTFDKDIFLRRARIGWHRGF